MTEESFGATPAPQESVSPSKSEPAAPSSSRLRIFTAVSVVLGLALVAVSAGVVWFRSRYPLTPLRLQQARQLWEQRGPKSYDLRIITEGRMPGTYWIEVRQQRVVRAVQQYPDGRETDLLTITLSDGRTLRRDGQEWSVPGLFTWLEQDLERDRSGQTSYTFARFDAFYGHPVEYLRSDSTGQYRFRVQLIPMPEP
jgi:hypothetical protein